VVPSFNQARYLPACLDSVLSQDYPDVELIVMDGGSTDGSADVLRSYGDRLAYWVSAPDGGQTRALIEGFRRSTGEIQCWLNSDDLHEPGALFDVAAYFTKHAEVDAVFGNAIWVDAAGKFLRMQKEIPFNRFLWTYTYNYIPGMSTFWRRSVYEKVGGLDARFDLAMDADLFIRFADAGARIAHVDRTWSRIRFYAAQKNRRLRARSDEEDLAIRRRYWGRDTPRFYALKRFVARGIRFLWRLLSGCYGRGYRVDLGRYA
jgi:glycosyltransferase involved in cell wall biosynthesis